ncbi:unnamed protein product [Clonostachys rosea f. rosea IK726]|uniref:3-hydroxyisobutyryl-CoA hydrolase n=2 Tax=Bionectria ochroleuca TaxID=29856 RepID=A0A0B7KDB4_BIOOC|nr:unnamed protein product [Clonostachys rosea f. rosea IK726]
MFARSITARAGVAANAASRQSIIMARQPGFSLGARAVSTEATQVKELPGDEPYDVVFESKYGLRTILLNRPKKLNSLNGSMIRKIVPRMVEWEKSDLANVVVMKGAGEKALCAGGDVAELARLNQSSPDGWKESADYFALEYKLDHYIATYTKPYIAFMDGITMGGGVGLSVHAPFRIATEKTVFAMPETTIGFFPDVGASFFLPRMNGSVGTYLALTSERLTGPNVFYSGIATHYLHSTSLPDLEGRLAELRFRDSDTLGDRLKSINQTLEEFSTGLPYDQPIQLKGELRNAIDRCFSKNNITDIIQALQQEKGPTEEWAQKTLETLKKRSPTAVHVALRQMRIGGKWDIAKTFQNEHEIATKFMKHPDFTEGVTALLVRKETPKWSPESLEAIPANQNVAKPFLTFDAPEKLELFTDRTFSEYPHRSLGIPSEAEIEELVSSNKTLSRSELAAQVISSRNGRQGVEKIVNEIIHRKTRVNDERNLVWIRDESASSKL